jgi:hypothetical protein
MNIFANRNLKQYRSDVVTSNNNLDTREKKEMIEITGCLVVKALTNSISDKRTTQE